MLQILETARLILKPRTKDDLKPCVEMDIDPEVTKYIPGVWDGSCQHIAFLEEQISHNRHKHVRRISVCEGAESLKELHEIYAEKIR